MVVHLLAGNWSHPSKTQGRATWPVAFFISKPARAEGRGIDVRFVAGHEFGQELAGAGGLGDAEHAVTGGDVGV